MWQIIIVKNLADTQEKKYREHIRTAERALRKRNRNIAHLSKKMYMLQEKVYELEAKLQIRDAQLQLEQRNGGAKDDTL